MTTAAPIGVPLPRLYCDHLVCSPLLCPPACCTAGVRRLSVTWADRPFVSFGCVEACQCWSRVLTTYLLPQMAADRRAELLTLAAMQRADAKDARTDAAAAAAANVSAPGANGSAAAGNGAAPPPPPPGANGSAAAGNGAAPPPPPPGANGSAAAGNGAAPPGANASAAAAGGGSSGGSTEPPAPEGASNSDSEAEPDVIDRFGDDVDIDDEVLALDLTTRCVICRDKFKYADARLFVTCGKIGCPFRLLQRFTNDPENKKSEAVKVYPGMCRPCALPFDKAGRCPYCIMPSRVKVKAQKDRRLEAIELLLCHLSIADIQKLKECRAFASAPQSRKPPNWFLEAAANDPEDERERQIAVWKFISALLAIQATIRKMRAWQSASLKYLRALQAETGAPDMFAVRHKVLETIVEEMNNYLEDDLQERMDASKPAQQLGTDEADELTESCLEAAPVLDYLKGVAKFWFEQIEDRAPKHLTNNMGVVLVGVGKCYDYQEYAKRFNIRAAAAPSVEVPLRATLSSASFSVSKPVRVSDIRRHSDPALPVRVCGSDSG